MFYPLFSEALMYNPRHYLECLNKSGQRQIFRNYADTEYHILTVWTVALSFASSNFEFQNLKYTPFNMAENLFSQPTSLNFARKPDNRKVSMNYFTTSIPVMCHLYPLRQNLEIRKIIPPTERNTRTLQKYDSHSTIITIVQ